LKNLFKPVLLTVLVIAVVLGSACAAFNQSSGGKAVPAFPPAPVPAVPAPPVFMGRSADMATSEAGYGPADSGSPSDRKIVRTGSMTMEVADIGKAQSAISDVATGMNGFVVSSSLNAGDDQPSGYISIRVPVDQFNNAMAKLRALAVKVVSENSNAQDVTEQYSDLQAQLRNEEATEAQYLELLKKAEKVEDILAVQRELSNVRGNIERLKGRIQYLDRTSDMSLIEVTLNKARPIGESTWDVGGIFKSAVDGLITFGKVLLGLLIWLLVFSPLWIIIIVVIWLVRRNRRKAKPA